MSESLVLACRNALTLPQAHRELVAPQPTREQLTALQEILAPYEQLDIPPKHHFADGQYVRELFIPAESFVVGKIHRHEHVVTLVSGEVTINTDRGMERLVGPVTWISPKGAKRALFTVTDCIFMTFHLNPSNTRDLDALEAELIEPEKELLE